MSGTGALLTDFKIKFVGNHHSVYNVNIFKQVARFRLLSEYAMEQTSQAEGQEAGMKARNTHPLPSSPALLQVRLGSQLLQPMMQHPNLQRQRA